MSEYYGHATRDDGSHVLLTKEQAETILKQVEDADAKRAAAMPTEQDAIKALFEAWVRLKELGWREAQYCPKDGSPFEVIEPGSTGIFQCTYSGNWPDGYYWVHDANDIYPSHPILFRLSPEAQATYDAKMKEAMKKFTVGEEKTNG